MQAVIAVTAEAAAHTAPTVVKEGGEVNVMLSSRCPSYSAQTPSPWDGAAHISPTSVNLIKKLLPQICPQVYLPDDSRSCQSGLAVTHPDRYVFIVLGTLH